MPVCLIVIQLKLTGQSLLIYKLLREKFNPIKHKTPCFEIKIIILIAGATKIVNTRIEAKVRHILMKRACAAVIIWIHSTSPTIKTVSVS